MSVRVELYTNFKCASGTRVGVVDKIIDLQMTRTIDHADALTLTVPWDSAWLASATLRRVLRVTDASNRVTEWRIKSIDDSKGEGDTTVTVIGQPPIIDLSTLGYLSWTTGGRTWFNNGGDNATSAQFIESWILPWLTDEGVTWIDIGTVDPDDRFSLAWDRWQVMNAVQEMASRTNCEFDLRRNGDTNYLLDIVNARGSSAAQVLLRVDRNMVTLSRQRRADTLKTVIVPVGAVPSGDVEVAGIDYNTWEVMSISGAGPYTVVLSDPQGGDGPIGYDNQFSSAGVGYLLYRDATLHQITASSASAQSVTVASVTNLSVGDYVEIRKNSSGDFLKELTNPTSVATYGRVVATTEVQDGRGERDHVPNAFQNNWTTPGTMILMQANGGQSGTSISFKSLPVGQVVPIGSQIWSTGGTAGLSVTTGGTANGSGIVTLVFGSSITVSDNQYFQLYMASTMPNSWSRVTTAAAYNYTDQSKQATLNALANGAHTSARIVNVDGLTAGEVILPGDLINGTAVSLTRSVVNGSGQAKLYLHAAVTLSDNAAVTITRAAAGEDYGANSLWIPFQYNPSGAPQWETPSYTLRYNSEMGFVWCSFLLTINTPSITSPGAGLPNYDDSGGASTFHKCKIEIVNANTNAILGTVTDVDREFVSGDVVHILLSKSIQITADTSIKLRLHTPYSTTTQEPGPNFVVVRAANMHIGFDPAAPAIDGSHANKLWHAGQKKLDELSVEPFSLSARVLDLAALNPDLSTETLEIGQSVRVMSAQMAGSATLDAVVRITSITADLMDPLNTQLVLETIPPRITRAIAKARARRLYVTSTVFVDQDGAVVSVDEIDAGADVNPVSNFTSTQDQIPPKLPEAPRIIIPTGKSKTDSGTGEQTISKYKRPT